MRIYFKGMGSADHISIVVEHPTCPAKGDGVSFSETGTEQWDVLTVVHMPLIKEYDVYCAVGKRR